MALKPHINANKDIWEIFPEGMKWYWRWKYPNGTVADESKGFDSLEDCVEDAQEHGMDGTLEDIKGLWSARG